MAKKIMRAFKIDEISVVDKPAQAGARMLITKRHIEKDAPFKTEDGKKFHAEDFAHVPDKEDPSTWKLRLTGTPGSGPDEGHVSAAAAALGAGFRGNKVELPSGARSGVVARVRSAWRKLNPDKSDEEMPEGLKKTYNEEDDMSREEMDALKAKHDKEIKDKDAELDKAKKEADMTDEEKKKYKDLKDEDAKKNWRDMSHEKRTEVLKNDSDSNAVVYKSESTGLEFRKSDDPRMVVLAKQADDNARIAKKATEDLENASLQKRADEILKHHPGTVEERAAMLKAVESIPDEAVRKKSIEALKASDAALAKAFTRNGGNGGDAGEGGSDALSKLDTMAKAYDEKNKVGYHKAYDAILQTTEGRELYAQTVKQ